MNSPVRSVGLIVLLIAVFSAGVWYGSNRGYNVADTATRKILYWHDPMHPSYKSDKPGIAPDCGMKLEAVYADGTDVSAPTESAAAPGTVRISSDRQQLIGVKVATVEKRPVSQTIRMLGRVAVDETRVYRINATVDGWITKTSPKATGSLVRKDEALAGFYSSEFLPVQTTFIYTLSSNDRVGAQDLSLPGREAQLQQFKNSLQQLRDNLRNLGMGAPQIEEIERTREYQQNIDIFSPADGIILVRNVSLGLRFERGTELYRIADLSHVWILADVFENEAQFLTPGITAKVAL